MNHWKPKEIFSFTSSLLIIISGRSDTTIDMFHFDFFFSWKFLWFGNFSRRSSRRSLKNFSSLSWNRFSRCFDRFYYSLLDFYLFLHVFQWEKTCQRFSNWSNQPKRWRNVRFDVVFGFSSSHVTLSFFFFSFSVCINGTISLNICLNVQQCRKNLKKIKKFSIWPID